MDQSISRRNRGVFAIGWLVLIAIAISYGPSLNGPFVFDDLNAFKGSNHVQSLPRLNSLLHPEHRPVVGLSFCVSDLIFGGDAFGRRLGNILIHLVACGFAFGLATVFAPTGVQNKYLFALVVASLWGIHPLATQAVAYIIQRAESLMALFFFALLWFDAKLGSGDRWRLALTLGSLFALGIYSKTVMIAALAVVPLFERAFLFETWREVWHQRKWVYGPPCVVGALSVIVLVPELIEAKAGVGFGGDAPPVLVYLMTQVRSIRQYAVLTVWPSQLAIDRGPHFVTSVDQIIPELLFLLIWVAAAMVLWLKFERHAIEGKKIAFLMIAPLLILAPSSSLVPTADPMFEHRMYAPLLFVIAWICTMVVWATRSLDRRSAIVSAGLFTIVFALLFVRTFVRCGDYASAPMLWAGAIRVDPENDRAIENFVAAMGEQNRSHLIEPALDQLIAESRAKAPGAGDAAVSSLRMYQAMQWVTQGRVDAAIPVLEEVAMIAGSDDRSAEERYTYRQRRDASTRFVNLAIAYRQAGRLTEAYEKIRIALEIDDTPPFGFAIAGYIAKDLGRYSEAAAHWERALELRKESWPELRMDFDRLKREHEGVD